MKEEIRERKGKPDPAIKSILSFGFSSLPHCFRRSDNMQFEDGGSFESQRRPVSIRGDLTRSAHARDDGYRTLNDDNIVGNVTVHVA